MMQTNQGAQGAQVSVELAPAPAPAPSRRAAPPLERRASRLAGGITGDNSGNPFG